MSINGFYLSNLINIKTNIIAGWVCESNPSRSRAMSESDIAQFIYEIF